MKISEGRRSIRIAILVGAFAVTAVGGAGATSCGSGTYPFPYTDVAGVGDAFCPGIMEAYVLGVTKGTTATTFSPNDNVSRTQMTTFLQRSIDQSLRRSSRRAALGQWWTPKSADGLQKVALPGPGPASFCRADGDRVWVGNGTNVVSVLASTGELAVTVPGLGGSIFGGVLPANGRVYSTDGTGQRLMTIRGTWAAPFMYSQSISGPLGYGPNNLAFDGDRIWTANYADGTIAIISVVNGNPQLPGTLAGGFVAPTDVIFDGTSIWVTDVGQGLHKLNADGSIAQTVPLGGGDPGFMVFDGANVWVANESGNSITVVQASTGAVVATIAGNAANGLSQPIQPAFDGERILVTNAGNDSVTLFRAADLSLIGNVALAPGSVPIGACSDGINFWVTLRGSKQLLRL
jgi:S-layer homology domain